MVCQAADWVWGLSSVRTVLNGRNAGLFRAISQKTENTFCKSQIFAKGLGLLAQLIKLPVKKGHSAVQHVGLPTFLWHWEQKSL
jgi:hypothetical protein